LSGPNDRTATTTITIHIHEHMQEEDMIVVRNIFQLKFGKAKDAIALAQESKELMKKNGHAAPRFMTDMTGEFYTFIMEMSFDNLAEYERSTGDTMGSKEFSSWYQKFIPLVDSGRREIYSVVS
jgi:hypothetical protein